MPINKNLPTRKSLNKYLIFKHVKKQTNSSIRSRNIGDLTSLGKSGRGWTHLAAPSQQFLDVIFLW